MTKIIKMAACGQYFYTGEMTKNMPGATPVIMKSEVFIIIRSKIKT
jgi:hypothetical protein